MPVAGRQPGDAACGHPHSGVAEAEGSQQVVGQVILQRPAGHSSDQDSEDAEGVVVAPALARLEGQGQCRQPGEPLVGPERYGVHANFDFAVSHRPLQRTLCQHHAVAGGAGQQVPQRDRPNGR